MGIQYAATVTLCIDDILEAVLFPRPVAGLVMIGEEYDLFWRFTKMKPPTFYCTEAEDT